jgi:hypothetical protein
MGDDRRPVAADRPPIGERCLPAARRHDTLWLGTYLQEVRENGTARPARARSVSHGAGVEWRIEGDTLVVASGARRRVVGPSDGFPLSRPRCVAASEGATANSPSAAVGGEDGLAVLRRGRWRYYAGRRWLPADRVTAVSADDDGVRVVTEGGPVRLAWRPMTLAQKAAAFEALTAARHNRRGYVTVCFRDAAAPGGWRHEASDNDGLWTALYVAAEVFRYAVTGDEAAREQASRSMAALLDLEALTPIPGFPARALVHRDEIDHVVLSRGEWHETEDGLWRWKGDTSSDELDGHFFAFAVYHDLIADAVERARVAAAAGRIADHLIDHGFLLVDRDGEPTRWGVYAPSYLETPRWAGDRGLNSLSILSHLKVAEALTGEARYREAGRALIEEHGYALNTIDQKITVPGHVNHSDDELAFLAYYPLLHYEQDPGLRAIYLASLRKSWEIERPERSPFFNVIYGALTGEPCDAEAAAETLREVPLDLVHWDVKNSHRPDVPRHPDRGRFGEEQSRLPLPFGERPIMKWNGNPYRLDGGDGGRTEEDGAFFLLPYWMGRHFGIFAEGFSSESDRPGGRKRRGAPR